MAAKFKPTPLGLVPKYAPGEWQFIEGKRRLAIVRRAQGMMKKEGTSMNTAAKRLAVPVANLWRYLAAFRTGGAAGLVPEVGTGRPSAADCLSVTRAEIRAIARLTRTENGIEGACRKFAKLPDCRRKLARTLKGKIPVSIRRMIKAAMPKSRARLSKSSK